MFCFFPLTIYLIDVSSGWRANAALLLLPPALWSVCVCVRAWLVILFVHRPAHLCAWTRCLHARIASAACVCMCTLAVYVVAALWPILCTADGCSVSVALLISMLELSAVSTPSTTLITDSLWCLVVRACVCVCVCVGGKATVGISLPNASVYLCPWAIVCTQTHTQNGLHDAWLKVKGNKQNKKGRRADLQFVIAYRNVHLRLSAYWKEVVADTEIGWLWFDEQIKATWKLSSGNFCEHLSAWSCDMKVIFCNHMSETSRNMHTQKCTNTPIHSTGQIDENL